MAQLVYETTDTTFADRAIAAMREADISCYRTGRGYSYSAGYIGRGATEDQVCLYIEDASDYVKANQILVKLGAVVEEPVRLPPKWVIFVLVLVATLLAIWVESTWR